MARRTKATAAAEPFHGLFNAFPRLLERHPICACLSHPAYRLLHLALDMHDGHNNGHLSLSITTLSGRYGWTSRDTLTRARMELMDAGLLIRTRHGGRNMGASKYALPWLEISNFRGLDLTPEQYGSDVRTPFRNVKDMKLAAGRSGLSMRDIADKAMTEWLTMLQIAGPSPGPKSQKNTNAGPSPGPVQDRPTVQRRTVSRSQDLTTGPSPGPVEGQKLKVQDRLPVTVAELPVRGVSAPAAKDSASERPDTAGMVG